MTDVTENDGIAEADELTAMPSITPEREDRVERKGKASSFRQKFGRVTATTPAIKTQRPAEQMRTLVAIALLAFALVIVIGGIVYLHDQLQKTQQSLQVATQRVEQLEIRLVSTDTSMTKSEILLGAKIKSMDVLIDANKTEVRKLWGAVEKNTKAFQVQQNMLQQQESALQNVTEQAKKTADQVAADGALLKTVDSTVKEAVQRVEIAQENISELSTEANLLKDKQARFEIDAVKRVAALEDTAKSTDVFRRNTQDELRKLREEMARQAQGTGTRLPQ